MKNLILQAMARTESLMLYLFLRLQPFSLFKVCTKGSCHHQSCLPHLESSSVLSYFLRHTKTHPKKRYANIPAFSNLLRTSSTISGDTLIGLWSRAVSSTTAGEDMFIMLFKNMATLTIHFHRLD